MKTLEELNAIKAKMADVVGFRSEEKGAVKSCQYERQVLVCAGTGCTSSGSVKIAAKLEEEI